MDVMPELYALPGMDSTPSGLQFNFNRAVPITVYICPGCGRFKFMSAMMLGNLTRPEAVESAQAIPQQAQGGQPAGETSGQSSPAS
jgi:hypothetical protein